MVRSAVPTNITFFLEVPPYKFADVSEEHADGQLERHISPFVCTKPKVFFSSHHTVYSNLIFGLTREFVCLSFNQMTLIPVAVRSMAQAYSHLIAGIAGSNPAVFFCVGSGLYEELTAHTAKCVRVCLCY